MYKAQENCYIEVIPNRSIPESKSGQESLTGKHSNTYNLPRPLPTLPFALLPTSSRLINQHIQAIMGTGGGFFFH